MPKVGGNTINECMSICMSDPKTIEEYPNTQRRTNVCYAACMGSLQEKITQEVIPMNEEEYFEVTHEDGLYIIDEDENPTLLVARGKTYVFDINAEGHPFWIKTEMVSGQESAYNNGIENNGIEIGELTFTVPSDAPNQLYYACEFHETMQGEILVLDKEQMTRAKLVKMFKVIIND